MKLFKQHAKLLGIMTLFAAGQQTLAADQPNVILIMTDDQGYGDISSHDHPYLITPNMDRLREMSVRLENFHVDPTCSPSRAALMTVVDWNACLEFKNQINIKYQQNICIFDFYTSY